jgi:hypothetical protein
MAIEDARNPMQGVSGPGPYARRTDLEYKPDAYGEGVQYAAEKAGAPLAKAPKSPMLSEAPQVPAGRMPAPSGIGLFEPTQRPDEPITQGVNIGPGAGSEVLAMRKSSEKLSDVLVKMLPYDTDGSVAILYQEALSRGN